MVKLTALELHMQNPEEFLGYSLIFFSLIVFIIILPKGLSGYAATLAGKNFKYKFNRKKLPLSIDVILALAIASFIYGIVVAPFVPALQFSLAIAAVSAVGSLIGLCLVPEETKK